MGESKVTEREQVDSANILYTEDITLSRSVKLYILTIYIVLIAMSAATAIIDPRFPLFSLTVAVIVTVFFALLYLNFRVLHIRVSENHLDIRYGRFQRKTIPITKIAEVEHIQIRLKDYGGVGIRRGLDGTWAYNTKLGDAVRITITDDRPFAFSTAHPERVFELLTNLSGLAKPSSI